jgi:GMP synthase-like glutamine amidotransferase
VSKELRLGFSPFAHPNDIYPFHQIFKREVRLDYASIKSCDAILLWGGTDINPKYYNEAAHVTNGYIPDSVRDHSEWYWMQEAVRHGIPIIGVCRGAQFLCAFAGGSLVQDVQGHNMGSHELTVIEDGLEKVYQTSSAHHQMMYLQDMEKDSYELLGWSKKRSNTYCGKGAPPVDPEVVFFPKIKGLAIQGHPEWQRIDDPFTQWCLNTIEDLVNQPKEPKVPVALEMLSELL